MHAHDFNMHAHNFKLYYSLLYSMAVAASEKLNTPVPTMNGDEAGTAK